MRLKKEVMRNTHRSGILKRFPITGQDPGPGFFFALGQKKIMQESCGIQDGHQHGSINRPRRYAISGVAGTAEIESTSQRSDDEL